MLRFHRGNLGTKRRNQFRNADEFKYGRTVVNPFPCALEALSIFKFGRGTRIAKADSRSSRTKRSVQPNQECRVS